MLRVDEESVWRAIEAKKPRRIVFNAPDGLLPRVQELAAQVRQRYGVEAFVVGDPCYGSCDTVSDYDVTRLGADLAFHVGHRISLDRLGAKTVLIDAYDDVSFAPVLEKALPLIRKYSRVGLLTISQHLHALPEARRFLEEGGVATAIGEGKGQLEVGQVFGCEFYPAFDIRDHVDAFLFLGQSPFHAIGVAMATQKPTLLLDPYLNEVTDVQPLAEERFKRSVLAVYRARDCDFFGVIVGLREGQMLVNRTLELKAKLEARGKTVHLLAMRDITNERLLQFPGIQAFIQTACPRLATDGYTFQKPVLSLPQAEALIRVLDGEDPGDFLLRSHWL